MAVLLEKFPPHRPTAMPLITASPFTSSFAHGVLVPIPTFAQALKIFVSVTQEAPLKYNVDPKIEPPIVNPLAVIPRFPVPTQEAIPFASDTRIFPDHCVPSVILIAPATSSFAAGLGTPIPILPLFP